MQLHQKTFKNIVLKFIKKKQHLISLKKLSKDLSSLQTYLLYGKFRSRKVFICKKVSGNLHHKIVPKRTWKSRESAKLHQSSRKHIISKTQLFKWCNYNACMSLFATSRLHTSPIMIFWYLLMSNRRSSWTWKSWAQIWKRLKHLEQHLKGFATLLSCEAKENNKNTFFSEKVSQLNVKELFSPFPSVFKNSAGTRECFPPLKGSPQGSRHIQCSSLRNRKFMGFKSVTMNRVGNFFFAVRQMGLCGINLNMAKFSV